MPISNSKLCESSAVNHPWWMSMLFHRWGLLWLGSAVRYNTSSVNDMLNDLDWPFLEDLRLKSSLTFFYKIHSGTVSLDKDKYLTPAPRLRSTRASHDSQYTRYMSYSDALKNSFFPRTIPLWNSLPSSVVASKTTEEFLRFLFRTKGPEVCVLVCLCLASCK